jgi:hypothetical protein
LNLKPYQYWLGCALSFLLATSAHAQAKARTAQTKAPDVPAPSCVIAEFRYLALTYHDPQERLDQVVAWLKRNGAACTATQMSILISSKAALMGTSDGGTLNAVIDGIMEKKLGSDHAAVSRYYRPEVQAPVKGREDSAPPQTTESGVAPSPTGAGANAGLPAGVAPMVSMGGAPVGGPVPTVAGTPNININMGGPKPEEDMSRKYPLPSEPMFAFPPEFGAPLLNYFGKIRRQFVRSFFMETLSPGKCPEGMAWRNDACESGMKVAWRFGEKLPQGAKTYPVDPKLVEKLNFDPGYTFVRVGGDILALERDTGKVADAVLNLGKAV